jgi:hypothetical protein
VFGYMSYFVVCASILCNVLFCIQYIFNFLNVCEMYEEKLSEMAGTYPLWMRCGDV